MTFQGTRLEHLSNLQAWGWTVALRDRGYRLLKVPYATSPGGQWRLWFKAQAVYFLHGPPFDFGNARSLTEDMRMPTEQLLVRIDRAANWERKHYPAQTRSDVESVSTSLLRRNSSEQYWVWAVDKKNHPLASEGPWGPYDHQAARDYARISATKGKHDRAVSRGRDPQAESFEIVRVYKAGTGEHKYGVAQMIGAPMQANGRISEVTRAYVRTYSDTGQVTAYVEWVDAQGNTGRTEGDPKNPHMEALLARARREGISVKRETW